MQITHMYTHSALHAGIYTYIHTLAHTQAIRTQPSDPAPFLVPGVPSVATGVEPNFPYRSSMEDRLTVVADFAGRRGSGYYAVFDGHAGRAVADFVAAVSFFYFLLNF